MHMPLKRKYMYIYYTVLCHVMPCYASCLILCYIILSILSSWVKWFHICLSHWGRVTHICVNKVTIIGSDNGLSPGRRQAIIWTNAGLLLIGPLETNFTETLINIQTFSFRKMHLKMSPGKWRPFCLGLNVLKKGLHTEHPPSGQNGRYLSDDMRKCIYEISFCISIHVRKSCPWGFGYLWFSIGPGNGLVQEKRRAIQWSSDDPHSSALVGGIHMHLWSFHTALTKL